MKPATRAFISYSSADEATAEKVKQVLSVFGLSSFLAHEDITVSEEWRLRIIKELSAAHLFVAILSQGFKQSEWASQELGFAVAKKIAILPLSIDGTPPFGLIAHTQGHRVRSGDISTDTLADPLARVLPDAIIPGLIQRLADAGSFRSAEALMKPLVPLFPSFTKENINDFVIASLENNQIWDAALCRRDYLPAFIQIHRRRIDPDMLRELRDKISG